MAAQANVTLNAVVYSPGGTNNGVSKWTNRTGGYGSSFTNLTEELVQPKSGSVVRLKFSLDVPIVETVGTTAPLGTLLRTSTVQVSVWLPVNSTAAERLDIYNRLVSLSTSQPVQDGIKNLEPTFG